MSHFGREPETFESLFCVFEFSGVWGSVGDMVGHKPMHALSSGPIYGITSGKLAVACGKYARAFTCYDCDPNGLLENRFRASGPK